MGTVESAAALAEGRGYLAAARRESAAAASHLQQAAAGWAALGRPYNQARVLTSFGRTLKQIGKTTEAEQTMREAQQLVDSLAAQLGDPTLRTSFLNSELVGKIKMDAGRPD